MTKINEFLQLLVASNGKVVMDRLYYKLNEDLMSDMIGCHDDPTYEPEDGPLNDVQFTWLGGLQYIHIMNGTPHYFRMPRVVLVSRLFAVCTAADASNVPDGYALGNIVFGDYERDEKECGFSTEDIIKGAFCPPVVFLMPIADVLVHPEYKNFGVKTSIALLRLLKPIRSRYMLPVCLPLNDFRNTTAKGNKRETYHHVDFTNVVPRDFEEEEKEIMTIHILPAEMCYVMHNQNRRAFDIYRNQNDSDPIREICTNGCGFRSGAPTIVHEHSGHWTLVALAEGGSPCPDPLVHRRSSPPPVHILLFPYTQWITTAITGRSVSSMDQTDPFGFSRRSQSADRMKKGWIGKWWMGSIRCYDRGIAAVDLFRFYHEVFNIHPNPDWRNKLNYYIELEAPLDVNIGCIKVGIPYRIGNPTVWGLYSPSAKIRIQLRDFHMPYKIEIEAWGYDNTESGSVGSEEKG